jgi:isopenicillin-N epimerase
MDMHGSRTLCLDHLRRASRAAEAAAAQAGHAPWWRKRDASDLTRYLDELLRKDGLRLKADDAAAATDDVDDLPPGFGRAMRKHFLFKNYTQLNHGAYGACPAPVMQAQWAYQRQMEYDMEQWMNNPWPDLNSSAGLVVRARKALAEYVNASADDVVLVDNASGAINALLRSLPLNAGDILVDFSVRYQPFAELYAWLAATKGVKIVTVPVTFPLTSPEQIVAALNNALRDITAVGGHASYVVVSHISSYPCIKMPVAELTRVSHEHGVPMIVDGAHALGNIPVDIGAMNSVDFWFGMSSPPTFPPKN